ncbi:MAG: hypothetical protein ACWA5W_05550 [Phycisphaerales bacterium]
MRKPSLYLAMMSFFVLGFVLASSGWSLVLGDLFKHKAEWSVCGQDMCSCLPSAIDPADEMEPDCPLCLLADEQSVTNTHAPSAPTDSRRRLPKNDRFTAAFAASQAGCTSIFLSFIFGLTNESTWIPRYNAHRLIASVNRPDDPDSDLPTPPPRA